MLHMYLIQASVLLPLIHFEEVGLVSSYVKGERAAGCAIQACSRTACSSPPCRTYSNVHHVKHQSESESGLSSKNFTTRNQKEKAILLTCCMDKIKGTDNRLYGVERHTSDTSEHAHDTKNSHRVCACVCVGGGGGKEHAR